MGLFLSGTPSTTKYRVMTFPITVFGQTTQPCALDRSSYSRRARRKSTAKANFFISVPRVLFQFLEPSRKKTALRFLTRQGEHLLVRSTGLQIHPICDTYPHRKNWGTFRRPQFFPSNIYASGHYGACSKAAVARLFTCFRRVLVPEPGRKEARAPRRAHRRRWQPSSPMQVPHPDRRLPVSRIRPCAPWSRCTVRR